MNSTKQIEFDGFEEADKYDGTKLPVPPWPQPGGPDDDSQNPFHDPTPNGTRP